MTRTRPTGMVTGRTFQVVGKGKGSYTGGTEIPPTRVNVVRPRPPGTGPVESD
ncbi:hypothetical protein [Paenibacillus sp. yr247]|uniref:hypothetical protein n=1 Tax=Paenibacillus sp. yr247 TaxID=1761880 RepID=UPI0015871801|nr:hypothetical protein [Paenibacillus sp. yr247]